jgi:Na+/H+-dicarboxylate symporter
MGGVVKIAFLFGLFHLPFSGLWVLATAVLVALLVGTVIGAIPSGGMVAEILILSLYGFPPQALIIIAAITILIDPPATVLNVNGDSVASMLVARVAEGRRWFLKYPPP